MGLCMADDAFPHSIHKALYDVYYVKLKRHRRAIMNTIEQSLSIR